MSYALTQHLPCRSIEAHCHERQTDCQTGTSTKNLPLGISWFETAVSDGRPAYGDPEQTTWGEFTSIFQWRREGQKDGCGFVAARFKREPVGRQVRRLKANLLARTAVALDIETDKKTGEVPPSPEDAIGRMEALGLACLLYTSHNHTPGNTRYRIVTPLTTEIAPELPAPEIMAVAPGLRGALDDSKIGAQSLFHLPSCPYDTLDLHQTIVIPGAAIDATWMVERAGALLAARQAAADRIAAEAQAGAAARRETKISAGFNPDDSLIEKLRSRFDLDSVLTSHGYDKVGTKYRGMRSATLRSGWPVNPAHVGRRHNGQLPRFYVSHGETTGSAGDPGAGAGRDRGFRRTERSSIKQDRIGTGGVGGR
jgi:hypothetical protein